MIVIDTDVLIGWLRNDARHVKFLERLEAQGEELATTSLNAAELYQGAEQDARREQALAAVRSALANLLEIPFGPRGARRFGTVMASLRKAGRPIPAVDGMIAALALENGGRLATGNVKHYSPVHGLEVLSP